MLAARLTAYRDRDDVVVLALPRGGVPVAREVARALGVPFDVLCGPQAWRARARRARHGRDCDRRRSPAQSRRRRRAGYSDDCDRCESRRASNSELERREQAYRGDRGPIALTNKTVILVDDGLATGSTMRAAVMAARQQQPARVIVAVPVGAVSTCAELAAEADDVVCVRTPDPFVAVGLWYRDFTPTTDHEVRSLLGQDT